MRGGYASVPAGGEAALPPLSVPVRNCRCQAVGSACKWPRQVASCWAVPLTKHRDWLPVRRAYKFRAYLTRPQDGRAVRLLADHCDLYNAALMERREAWQMRRGHINYGRPSAQPEALRRRDRG